MTKTIEYTAYNPLISSLVKNAWYVSPRRELYVELRNGSVYGYSDVAPIVYENFILSGSKGAFYNNSIKRQYSSTGSLYKSDLEFRPAPGLSRSRTDARVWGSTAVFGGPNPVAAAAPAVEQKKPAAPQRYNVSGYVLKPTKVNAAYYATSMEEAIAKFREDYKDKEPEVDEVRKV